MFTLHHVIKVKPYLAVQYYIFSSPNSVSIWQFADQIGLTPEEAISRIMANPEVALAFQNPRVQAAIMDVCHT